MANTAIHFDGSLDDVLKEIEGRKPDGEGTFSSYWNYGDNLGILRSDVDPWNMEEQIVLESLILDHLHENKKVNCMRIVAHFFDDTTKKNYQIITRMPGKNLMESTREYVNSMEQAHYDKYVKDAFAIMNTGLFRFDGNPRNILADPQKGFSFIDFDLNINRINELIEKGGFDPQKEYGSRVPMMEGGFSPFYRNVNDNENEIEKTDEMIADALMKYTQALLNNGIDKKVIEEEFLAYVDINREFWQERFASMEAQINQELVEEESIQTSTENAKVESTTKGVNMNKQDYSELTGAFLDGFGTFALTDPKKLILRVMPNASPEFVNFVSNNILELNQNIKTKYKEEFKQLESEAKAEYRKTSNYNPQRPLDYGNALDGLNAKMGEMIAKDLEYCHTNNTTIMPAKIQSQSKQTQTDIQIPPTIASAIKKAGQQEQTTGNARTRVHLAPDPNTLQDKITSHHSNISLKDLMTNTPQSLTESELTKPEYVKLDSEKEQKKFDWVSQYMKNYSIVENRTLDEHGNTDPKQMKFYEDQVIKLIHSNSRTGEFNQMLGNPTMQYIMGDDGQPQKGDDGKFLMEKHYDMKQIGEMGELLKAAQRIKERTGEDYLSAFSSVQCVDSFFREIRQDKSGELANMYQQAKLKQQGGG